MGLVTTDYGIKEALKQLGIAEVNDGSSTGAEFFANGDSLSSFSPVDGKLIAKVTTTSKEDFERVWSVARDNNSGEPGFYFAKQRSPTLCC